MKTEAQLARTELELSALDRAYAQMRYLNYNPKTDKWSTYLKHLESNISAELSILEHFAKYPEHRFG